ncbi:MAG: hypothetical protein ACFUZC_19005 [Chthoniobacteraceae bacterium]
MERKIFCPKCGETVEKTAQCIREHPEKAALFSLGIGFLLAQLPLRLVMAAVASLVLTVIKPAALIYGLFRLAEDVYHQPRPAAPNPDEQVSP